MIFRRQALRRHALGGLLLSAILAVPVIAAPVTLNLKDAEINALVESMSVLTGKNFIVDPRVKGRVTIISAKAMDEQELYQVFLAVLGVHGFAAVPSGNVIKIVPAAGAKQESIPTVDRRGGVEPDQIVTRVIQVQNVSAAQIVPILRPLIPPQGHLAAYTPTNVLIISDSAANVERIASIIARVDLASNEEVEIVALRHASAAEIVRVLTALEQSKARNDPAAAVGTPPRMVADERTNSILLSGDKASRLRLRALVTHLDTPLDSGGNTQVVYLRYAKAKDLMAVLQGVSKSLSSEAARNAPMPGQASGAAPGGNSSSSSNSLVDIQADVATNALVITAPPDLIRSLRSVIAQLDIRRAQVLVEAVIAEITLEKTAELGVQWVADAADSGLVGFTNFNTGANSNLASVLSQVILFNNSSSGSTTAASINPSQIPEGMHLGVGNFTGDNRFGALISALAKDSDANVLSTPTLVTLDNEEAEITVGQNVPLVTGSYTTSTSSGSSTNSQVGNPFQTIQREDVGVILKVKPQINEGNAVKLEITQKVSNVVPSANASAQGLTFNKREIKTNVLVEDGQILVLGGLIDDSLNQSAQKVPLLGDVPLLGNLFRYRNTDKLKRNLMVFLHPVILRNSEQGALYTGDKYSYIREQQLVAREKADYLLPNVQPPTLKPVEEVKAQGTILNLSPPPSSPPPSPPPPSAPAEFGFSNK
ncbi:MAG: type II secretion system secretin GspD [Candidatus Contendobacter sp.]|nr:type II secretion system secretin GspD [Candidatus Contendobacter sp.]